MQMLKINGVTLHYADEGDPDGAPLVFANALGTDFRLWDAVLTHLPKGLRIIRYDKRGHGLTDAPDAPYFMGDLVADVAGLLDELAIKDVLFVGLSIGGMIAQGLAAERPDLVRAMVLSNTAAKIGTPQIWDERFAAVRKGGIEALEMGTISRWFSYYFHNNRTDELAGWSNMLCRTTVEGYIGCSEAISGTDLHDSTMRLTLPTLGIAGSEDGSTPPDMVRETVALIEGSEFRLMRGVGHLPCVEDPETFAEILTGFMKATNHV